MNYREDNANQLICFVGQLTLSSESSSLIERENDNLKPPKVEVHVDRQ